MATPRRMGTETSETRARLLDVTEQIMLEGRRRPAGRIVVYDGDGYLVAGALAELLALEGREVELITGHETIAPFCAETLEDVLVRQRLHECGVAMRAGTVLTGIQPGSLTFDDAPCDFGAHIVLVAPASALQRILETLTTPA